MILLRNFPTNLLKKEFCQACQSRLGETVAEACDLMDDVELRKEAFAWFGAAVYYAQCIEVELIIARLFLARRGASRPSDEEWRKIEAEKRTMGRLLQFLQKQVEIRQEEVEVLNQCLGDRNFMAHDYWYRRSSLLATPSGCEELIAELQQMAERLKRGNAIAEAISRRVRAQVGIDEALVRQVEHEFITRLCGGEPEDAIIERQAKYLQKLGPE